jgi:hypothetical protein
MLNTTMFTIESCLFELRNFACFAQSPRLTILNMPMDMKALAQLGARARLSQLQEEISELQRAFPDLGGRSTSTTTRRRGRRARTAPDSAAEQGDAAQDEAPATVRKRKPMTAAQKKSVGERMRKYWAARRKAEKKG